MWPDQVSNPGPLTYESGALPTALRGPAFHGKTKVVAKYSFPCKSNLPVCPKMLHNFLCVTSDHKCPGSPANNHINPNKCPASNKCL